MKIAVWDTYVRRNDGTWMHFDILVPDHVKDENQVFEYGKRYLDSKSFETYELTSKQCRFCHMEIASEETELAIKKTGFSIIEMENCQQ